jgi:cell division protein ZapA
MPDLDITIGGRVFQVACQPGEEPFLRAAAQMLDTEAQPLVAQMGRMPELKMLLMAGLMLADKTAAVEDEAKALRTRLAAFESNQPGMAKVPTAITDMMAELAARAEALAASVEEKAARHG